MNILVIGGGMAGLTYAIVAAKNGHNVTLCERNSRVGKKIAMTGNGRCNIGNVKVDATCYNKSAIVKSVLEEISVDEYRRFLRSCGILTYCDHEGRLYPLTDNANSVVDCLRHQFYKFGGKTLVDTEVTSFVKVADKFQVNIRSERLTFDKLVLACGSKSQSEPLNIYYLVPADVFTPMVPSLVPVKIRNMDGTLNGLRAKADVSLYDGIVELGKECGEVQFKDYGLSGICIFNLSAIIARREILRKKSNYRFVVDAAPYLKLWDLEEIIYNRLRSGEHKELFYGVLHNKLAEHVLRKCKDITNASELAYTAKNLNFEFDHLLDWTKSQVTAGGIDERYVNLDTLQLNNGVVVLGEILNVDGICGGNNLFFAAASALYTFDKQQRETAYTFS